MKRALLLIALAAMLVLAAQSAARVLVKHRFSAPLQGGVNNAGLELNAFYKKGVPKYVTDIEWHNLACPAGGYIPFAGVQHWTVDVNDSGKFRKTHAVHNGNGAKVTITGKFTEKGGKSHLAGKFTLFNTPSCPNGTGTLKYNARQL